MYKDEYHPKIEKDLKKIDKSIVTQINKEHIDKVLEDPYKNEELKGNLSGIRSYYFRKNKIEYRICYLIDENKKTVYFLMMGKRENIYNILKQRFKR